MKRTSLALFAALTLAGLAACDRTPAVVAAPANPVIVQSPVPGPAGAQGETGKTGATGTPGENAAVIIMAPASAPAN
ncbi:hypothetical protein [Rhodoferax saidenbachensis]|uniref:Collagen-like protein n=1 Tax=Rhodoferax saidenbachensis TaxID=1484693 RepID=A0A1P8KD06_9BURK|nr:hypothetical protein [Rhodoferax saidenbachensis]APW43818.1 hypothetical protein RS694_15600 [Rhodoferax saidenbachensis]